jgi:hypothetical protein
MATSLHSVHAEFSDTHLFSLFEGDLVSRVFAYLGMGSYGVGDLLKRSLLLISVTWVPLALLAIATEVHWIQPPGQNFFLDFAAYGQLIIGLPMFLVAERVIDRQTRDAARCFLTTGVVEVGDASRLSHLNGKVERLRKQLRTELLCIGLSYVITAAWIVPEMYNDRDTWHAMGPIGQLQTLTWPGLLELVFVGPLTTYWWLRWSWKIGIWSWYLYRLSRLRLNLVASHPDKTGGIGFLSDAQTKFGIVILAYGFSNVAPTIGYTGVRRGHDVGGLRVGVCRELCHRGSVAVHHPAFHVYRATVSGQGTGHGIVSRAVHGTGPRVRAEMAEGLFERQLRTHERK